MRARSLALAAAIAGCAAAVPATASADSRCQSSGAQSFTCVIPYTGAATTWTVPAGVTRTVFDLFGSPSQATGSAGGETMATVAVFPGQVLEIVVGGPDGFNGGGDPGTENAGGGASDVRWGACAASASCPLGERMLVAGGAGGMGDDTDTPGAGGGLSGTAGQGGSVAGGGGTQTAGGSGGVGTGGGANGSPGTLGQGGAAAHAFEAGGGGGGYYGGGAGAVYQISQVGFAAAPGGGGSGFVRASARITNASMQTGVYTPNACGGSPACVVITYTERARAGEIASGSASTSRREARLGRSVD